MKYGEIVTRLDGSKGYWANEDAIVDEAFERLDDKLKEQFGYYEQGYGTYFKDFEQWFDRYAPEIWSDVLEEAEAEKSEAEADIENEVEEDDHYDEQVEREYYRDRI